MSEGRAETLRVENPLRERFLNGLQQYTPVFRGETLPVEDGDPATSLKNLHTICECLGPTARIVCVELGPQGGVLIGFDTGECFLACGLGVQTVAQVNALAKFLCETGISKFPLEETQDELMVAHQGAHRLLRLDDHFHGCGSDGDGELKIHRE